MAARTPFALSRFFADTQTILFAIASSSDFRFARPNAWMRRVGDCVVSPRITQSQLGTSTPSTNFWQQQTTLKFPALSARRTFSTCVSLLSPVTAATMSFPSFFSNSSAAFCARFFVDQNTIVVLPIGGVWSSTTDVVSPRTIISHVASSTSPSVKATK